jgi:hypothetical protein
MPRRKPTRFSATKAVKANARERVGQPKPVRVIEEKPPEGRRAPRKPRTQDLLDDLHRDLHRREE